VSLKAPQLKGVTPAVIVEEARRVRANSPCCFLPSPTENVWILVPLPGVVELHAELEFACRWGQAAAHRSCAHAGELRHGDSGQWRPWALAVGFYGQPPRQVTPQYDLAW